MGCSRLAGAETKMAREAARYRFYAQYWAEGYSEGHGLRKTSKCKKESVIKVPITPTLIILLITKLVNSTISKTTKEATTNNMFSGIYSLKL
jgi:hypothetical protein